MQLKELKQAIAQLKDDDIEIALGIEYPDHISTIAFTGFEHDKKTNIFRMNLRASPLNEEIVSTVKSVKKL